MAKPYPQLVLFGDSLFQHAFEYQGGFSLFAELQIQCIRRLDVVNRGFSGWNTTNALHYLPEIFPARTDTSPKIDYMVILLGTNDAILPLSTTKQHVPIEQYKENLNKIITHPHIQAHNPKILLVTPPPVDQIKVTKLNLAEGHESAIRTLAISAEYSEKAREVARENPSVVLIDLWQALMDEAIALAPNEYQPGGPWLGTPENGKQGGLDKLLPDGVHLSSDAYRVFYNAICSHIGQQWTTLPEDDRTGYIFPEWRTFDRAY